jgi:hypothetical protein
MAMLRRIKEKLKKVMQKSAGKKIIAPATFEKKAQKKPEAKEQALGIQEMAVEKTKFSQPEVARIPRAMPADLPYGYGQDKIVLQVRDAWWLHSYWEVTHATYQRLQDRLGEAFHGAKRVLRVYDISHIIFNGTNAHRFFDIEVGHDVNNWYIDAAGPGRSWCVDYGLRLPNGEFITIVRSNTVHTPIEGPSWITDEEWMVPDDLFARLYGMGFGLGRSSPVGKAWQERVRRALFSGVLASPGMTSLSSPVKKAAEKKFWLIVNTELIVYGATEPDAKVTVQGRPIDLRSDGTFTLRYALPDGKQVIPVKANSCDSVEERTITPIVVKETK